MLQVLINQNLLKRFSLFSIQKVYLAVNHDKYITT